MSRLSKQEGGIGQVFIISLIVVIAAVTGVIIWRITKSDNDSKKNTNISVPANYSSETNQCMRLLNNSLFCSFAKNTDISKQQYIATGTVTSSSGSSSYTIQNDGQGNTQVTYIANGNQVSAISLDGSTFIQTGASATWLEYSGNNLGSAAVTNPVSNFNLNFSSYIPAGVTVDSQGTAACGSLTCNKYKVNVASNPTATQYVYFDTSDYLLRQWTCSNLTSNTSVNLNFSYEPVTITRPTPVQQISS